MKYLFLHIVLRRLTDALNDDFLTKYVKSHLFYLWLYDNHQTVIIPSKYKTLVQFSTLGTT